MPKSSWEDRVGKLLDPDRNDQFLWSFKPYDSSLYGGQPRIDWLACDVAGRFWMIEVKKLASTRKTFNLLNDVSPGQRLALDSVGASECGIVLLAIGHDADLYLFDWRDITWRYDHDPWNPKSHLLPLDDAFLTLTWTGPKHWTYSLYRLVLDRVPSLAPAPAKLGKR
jgi:hypothetical protein